jgi:hypothetical protein
MRIVPLTLLVLATAAAPVTEPVTRTVYVTVTDDQGLAVPDLTATDFTVKEGGKERDVVKAERATGRQRVALLVEDRLVADGAIRTALFEFMKRMQGSADIALITVGLRNTTLVDYTADGDALVKALNSLSLNPQPISAITEGLLELTKSIEQQKAARPVIVTLAFSGGQAGGAPAKQVLEQLRQSAAVMHSVTLAGFEGTGNSGIGTLSEWTEAVGRPPHRDCVDQSGHQGPAAGRRRPAGPVRDFVHAARRRQARQALQRERQAERRLAPGAQRNPGALVIRGALPLGLPDWFARGGPKAPLRSPGSLAVLARAVFLIRGALPPRTPRLVSASAEGYGETSPKCLRHEGGRSRGPQGPAPLTRPARD